MSFQPSCLWSCDQRWVNYVAQKAEQRIIVHVPGTPRRVIEDHGLEAPPRGMVAVGGMEGVRDEAAIFLKQRKGWNIFPQPEVYAFGSGGAAATTRTPAQGD